MPAAAQKRWEFTVEGRHDFPFDMLRYDQCWPKREAEDSSRLGYWRPTKSTAGSTRQVTLIGLSAPTLGRWDSFGWKVLSSREFKV